jgi:hypothetical protein
MSGNITASSSSYGSGIGSGLGEIGNSTVVNLTIVSGNITANSSSYGSGIGSGQGIQSGSSTVEFLSVLGGTIRSDGVLVGIGSGGEGSETRRVTFSGTVAVICNADGTKFPINASSILLSDASLIFVTQGDRLFGVSPSHEGWLNLTILYGSTTSPEAEPLLGLNAAILQIGNLSFNPPIDWHGSAALPCTFCISRAGDGGCIATHSTEVTEVESAVLSLPSSGSYSIRAMLDGWIGVFETPEGVSLVNISSNFTFIEEGQLVWFQAMTSSPSPTASFTVALIVFLHSRKMIFQLLFGFLFVTVSLD